MILVRRRKQRSTPLSAPKAGKAPAQREGTFQSVLGALQGMPGHTVQEILPNELGCLSTEELEQLMQEAVAAMERQMDKERSFCPHPPHEGPQRAFVEDCITKEILYGGAAGGGKTDALLMAALRYVHVPGYSAIIFRRTYPQLALADGLIDRSREWLTGTGAVYNKNEHKWTFPSGAELRFAQLQYDQTVHDHHGAAYHFIGYDELTQFTEKQYKYLFSRLRRKKLKPGELEAFRRKNPNQMHHSEIPLRVRAASNPGDIGHVWVKKRFISDEGQQAGRRFIPASLRDNPSLDAESYLENLGELDSVSRAQLLDGNWDLLDNCLISYELVEAARDRKCLWPMGVTPESGPRKELYIGVDIGRTRDLTVIWTFERVHDLFVCRECKVLEKAKFSLQKKEIQARLTKHVVACRIDKGGIGMQLAEELEEEYPNTVEGVQLTTGRQGQLAKIIQTDFTEGRVRIPDDRELDEDIQLVRKTGTNNGIPVVQTIRGEVGHGDRFWAMALARYGAPYERKKAATKIAGSKTNPGQSQSTGKPFSPIRGSARSMNTRKVSAWRSRTK